MDISILTVVGHEYTESPSPKKFQNYLLQFRKSLPRNSIERANL